MVLNLMKSYSLILYSVDFQQYLVILKSLFNELPLINPITQRKAYYHFGFLLPLASTVKILITYTQFF